MLSPSELHGDVGRVTILTTLGFIKKKRMDASRQSVLPAMSDASLWYAWTKPGLWSQMDVVQFLSKAWVMMTLIKQFNTYEVPGFFNFKADTNVNIL